jgi:hypothetical protein
VDYEYIDIARETSKAIMFTNKDGQFCWIPKSCIILRTATEFRCIDTFTPEWKGEGATSTPKVCYSERVITLTDEVKRDIWEYI